MEFRQSLCVLYCVHDDHWFLRASIRSFQSAGPVLVLVSRLAWNGEPGDWERCRDEAEAAGAEVILGDWPDESLHRRTALQEARDRGFTHALIPDGDEVVEPKLLEALIGLAQGELAERVHVHMDTYWKSPRYVVRPREALTPALLLDLRASEHVYIRDYRSGRSLTLGPDYGVLHHLSYAGPDERIQRKIRTWGHRSEVAEDWYRRVWLAWDRDHAMRDLHPTHPPCYGFVERIETPECLNDAWDERPANEAPPLPKRWPTVSIVIPLHGGEEDIRVCLDSLSKIQDLVHETIVVDDASPDSAPRAVAEFPFATLVENERNLGFAGTCNRGYEASTGDVVVFLNSDTAVPRAGLIRLVETLMSSGSIGAAGPMTNNAGYHQPTFATYTSLDRLDLFANDFAQSHAKDEDVSMLVGFCLAVRRSVLEEVGVFDERFGRGMFEDNDLGYRIERAGYRLRLSRRAYVHHEGHKTLSRLAEPMESLLERNERIFHEKWRSDLESGFVSHLPGRRWDRIVFDESRHPDRLTEELELLRKQADVSLCMIVRNEERVLGDCLKSVAGVFSQVIVVDTGSSDRTKEIALEHGAELYDFPWTESFAEARNESLKYAKGRWLMWMDADDTLPPQSARIILEAAINAPKDVAGFVIPVRFTDGGIAGGTQVDHVKLFRNVSGVSFEGRIHEQVLQSIRPHGEIARLEGAVVLHTGYDVSTEGQARKRARDARLLELDLAERPNHPFVLFNLGMTAHYNGDHEAAVDWLRKSIEVASPKESHIRKAYALMGVSLRELKRPDEALQAFDEGLAVVGPDPELHFQAAVVLSSLKRYEEALARYREMPLEVGGHFTSIDMSILGPKRAHNMATVSAAMGDYGGAKALFQEAIAGGFAPSALSLFELAQEREDVRAAREALDALGAFEGRTLEWIAGRARLAELRGEDPLKEFVDLANAMPRDPRPRLALARWLIQSKRTTEAAPILERLDVEGVAEAAFHRSVLAVHQGDWAGALMHARRARQLDPSNPINEEQVRGLAQTLASIREGKEHLLLGPYAGDLGPASIPLSVVIVTFNSKALIGPCLESLLPQLGEGDEVIVIDNASTDDTVSAISKDPRIHVLSNEDNVGYARAANQGVLRSRGERILLLNPDVVLGEGTISTLVAALAPEAAAVGPLSDAVGGDQFVTHHLPPGHRPPKEELPSAVRRLFSDGWTGTKMLMGLCLLVPRDVFDQFGLLEERCELGADDLELSWRWRQRGLELRIALGAFVNHVGGASFGTLPSEEKRIRLAVSDAALVEKLRAYFDSAALPTSEALFGCDIFTPALRRAGWASTQRPKG